MGLMLEGNFLGKVFSKNFQIYYRKGVVKFVSKKFPKQRKEIKDLEKTALVRITSDFKVRIPSLPFHVIIIHFRKITAFQLT